jgi:zinc protease
LIEAALTTLLREGVSQAELDKAKNRLELGFLHGMETASGKAEQLGFYETVLSDAGRIFKQLDAYRAVSAEDVRRVAAARLAPTQRTTIFVRPKLETDAEAA